MANQILTMLLQKTKKYPTLDIETLTFDLEKTTFSFKILRGLPWDDKIGGGCIIVHVLIYLTINVNDSP